MFHVSPYSRGLRGTDVSSDARSPGHRRVGASAPACEFDPRRNGASWGSRLGTTEWRRIPAPAFRPTFRPTPTSALPPRVVILAPPRDRAHSGPPEGTA
jgi:hypothetical protein